MHILGPTTITVMAPSPKLGWLYYLTTLFLYQNHILFQHFVVHIILVCCLQIILMIIYSKHLKGGKGGFY